MASHPTRSTATTIRPELLRPTAEVVDTYVRPGKYETEGDNLRALAASLSKSDAALSGLLAEYQAEQDKEDALRAQADFHANNGQGFMGAIRADKIPAFASKAYVQAYKRTAGQNVGFTLQAKFAAEYDKLPKDMSLDDYNRWAQDFTRRNLSEDPHVNAGLVPQITAMTQQGLGRFIRDKHEETKRAKENEDDGARVRIVEEKRLEDLKAGKKPDWGTIWKRLAGERERAVATGTKADEWDTRAMNFAAAMAVEKRDPEFLGFFNQAIPGTNVRYRDTEHGRTVLASTLDKLRSLARQGQSDLDREAEKERKAKLEDITRRTQDAIAANPAGEVPEDLIKEGQALDGDFRTKATGWRTTLNNATGVEDARAILELNDEIMRGGGSAAISRALQNGTIRKAETLREALSLNAATQAAGGENGLQKVWESTTAHAIENAIRKRLAADTDQSNPFAPKGWSDPAIEARAEFRERVARWHLVNPEATPEARDRAVYDIGQHVLSRITGYDTGGGGKFTPAPIGPPQGGAPTKPSPRSPTNFGSPPGAPAPGGPPGGSTMPPLDRPLGGGPAGPQATPAQPPAPEPAEVQRWMGTLPPEQQDQLKAAAQKQGVPVEQFAVPFFNRDPRNILRRPLPEPGAAGRT